jgi:hypothetical protein
MEITAVLVDRWRRSSNNTCVKSSQLERKPSNEDDAWKVPLVPSVSRAPRGFFQDYP